MSDKPMDTPFNAFTAEELDDMPNNELMDRGIALTDLGLDGWIDGIVGMAATGLASAVVYAQAQARESGDSRQQAIYLQAAFDHTLHALFDAARMLGKREERGEI